jgi:hypothetical protein
MVNSQNFKIRGGMDCAPLRKMLSKSIQCYQADVVRTVTAANMWCDEQAKEVVAAHFPQTTSFVLEIREMFQLPCFDHWTKLVTLKIVITKEFEIGRASLQSMQALSTQALSTLEHLHLEMSSIHISEHGDQRSKFLRDIVIPLLEATKHLRSLMIFHAVHPDQFVNDLEQKLVRLIETRHAARLDQLGLPFDPDGPCFPNVASKSLELGSRSIGFDDLWDIRRNSRTGHRTPSGNSPSLSQMRCETLILNDCTQTIQENNIDLPTGVHNLVLNLIQHTQVFLKPPFLRPLEHLKAFTVQGLTLATESLEILVLSCLSLETLSFNLECCNMLHTVCDSCERLMCCLNAPALRTLRIGGIHCMSELMMMSDDAKRSLAQSKINLFDMTNYAKLDNWDVLVPGFATSKRAEPSSTYRWWLSLTRVQVQ